ncbi:DUF4270 domain-containing protein [Epilithonimonas sp.]|uniref:DUF4270 domain-containing protein n=1 Tax=Epilithonimonas sp. TaxID=2894511 RepID=UPI0028A21FA7|nr:DUF4270 domain-containing protein [Epilithonimonas sp.]
MINIKKIMKLIPLLVMGIVVLNSCEGELDDLGSQLVDGSGAYSKIYALTAYNVNNGDVQKVVTSQYDSVRIGALREDVFGGQKVSYITQLRLNTYDPDFGKNPVIDSVVLTLKPRYETATDSLTTTTNEDYIYPDGQVAAKKVVTTYPVRKYGKYKINGEKTPFTIKVHEVADFLGGASDSILTNKAFALSSEIGSKSFNGTVNSVVITKDSDASELLNRAVSFRMELKKEFFQDKIIAKQGNQVLKDAASFIRYFRGISISVEQNDGYLFSMAPNDAGITIYYKNDVTATDGTVTKTKQETTLNLGASNVHLSQVVYDRVGTPYYNAINPAVKYEDLKKNPGLAVNPADKLYLQGMGGSGIGIRIPQSTIDSLKQKFQNDKIAIVSAKIRLYNNADEWNNKFRKPSSLLVQEMIKDTVRFLPDMTSLASAGYSLIKTADLSTKDAYYDVGVTASLKDIVEKNKNAHDFVINVGSYLSDASTGTLLGQAYNDRPYNPFRIALKGTDINSMGHAISPDSKNVQLRIIYTKK